MTDMESHPASWRGSELLQSGWEHVLTEQDETEIAAALEAAADRALEELTPETFRLSGLAPRLAAIQHDLEHGSGAVRLRGLRVEGRSESDLRRIFWGLMSHLGTPVSQSATGERLLEVRDASYGERSPQTRGPNTNRSLRFHTDRCDVIAFLCVRAARSGGENEIVSSLALHHEINRRRPDLLQVLLEPFVYQRHNVDAGSDLPFTRQPVFSVHDGHFAAVLLRVLIDRADADPELPSMTDAQREALDVLEEIADEPGRRARFRQEPGDLLLLNNYVIFHRRTAFEDHEDPERRRLLLRLWLSVPNSRPLDPVFRDYLGATEAGALRGGMRPKEER